jgi:hypothetical protein
MTKQTKLRVLSGVGLVLGVFGVFLLTISFRNLRLLPDHPAYVAGSFTLPLLFAIGGFVLWYRYGRKLDALNAASGHKRERNIAEPPT